MHLFSGRQVITAQLTTSTLILDKTSWLGFFKAALSKNQKVSKVFAKEFRAVTLAPWEWFLKAKSL